MNYTIVFLFLPYNYYSSQNIKHLLTKLFILYIQYIFILIYIILQ